ncbi:MAG TPA: histidine kinase [Hanamia sp.]|nr:histidine kinase [Hanamia sp.]
MIFFAVQNFVVAGLSLALYTFIVRHENSTSFIRYFTIFIIFIIPIVTNLYILNKIYKGEKVYLSNVELKALRSQMNPHFIFNSLNSIADYLAKNNTKTADEYLVKFAQLMRLMLENSERKELPLSQDLKVLELYLQLESLRLNINFNFEIKIDEDIDIENTLIPPLILQPFVENSIWHGLASKEGDGQILIQIKKEGKMIRCIIEDNGVGRKNAEENLQANKNKNSLGMKITKTRIDIINTLKNSNAAVNILDLSEGMRAEVTLPLELSF